MIKKADKVMAVTPSGSSAATTGKPVARASYEPPVVLAVFPKGDLAGELPENLTPHLHAVQNS